MLQFASTDKEPQTLRVRGLTIANPPYHSFVVYGDYSTFRMDVQHYKQVGAWYWQTDGLEIYDYGVQKHSFIHSNDDAIKVYHSNIEIDDTIVWKGENGPAVQFGWIMRDMQNVRVHNVEVLHNLMHYDTHNICLLNSAKPIFDGCVTQGSTPSFKNVTLANIQSYGANLCAMRLYVYTDWQDITISDLKVESWSEAKIDSHFESVCKGAKAEPTPMA